MNTLYLLGGPPRTAKTTIMASLAKEKGMSFIAVDAVQHGMRNILTDEPHQMLRDIEFSGSAEWKTSITGGGQRMPFNDTGSEAELTLKSVIGMVDYYRRNKESVAFEGSSITPKWVHALQLEDFEIRAAFVGFTNASHADEIISYARANPHDWINDWLVKDHDDETNIRDWIAKQSQACKELQAEAEQFGYKFFDISAMPFANYVATVQQYFLEA